MPGSLLGPGRQSAGSETNDPAIRDGYDRGRDQLTSAHVDHTCGSDNHGSLGACRADRNQ
jgi:hypothetical protein